MGDGIPMAVWGHCKTTRFVSLLVNSDDVPIVRNQLHDMADVKIELRAAGGYPGDGKPNPVSFPDPAACSQVIDDIRYINLETLIELKLASGMRSPGRLKDLSDVQELIRARKLGEDFADKLNPYVREKYLELCRAVLNFPPQEE